MLDKIILAPYYLTLKLRHAMYDHCMLYKVHRCEVPTICVGNITAGGTGKTPHTEMILKSLLESDDWAYRNISVLSRGHKRTTGGFMQVVRDGAVREYGDEPLQIKKKFPAVTVAVDRKRVEGCDFLVHPEKISASKRGRYCEGAQNIQPSDLIILDDAFQHRALKAYFNIVLVDYNRPLYKDKLLPFGRLRDLPERLHQADVIIVTKCPNYMEDEEKVKWAASLGIKEYSVDTCTGVDDKGNSQMVLFTAIHYCPLRPIFEDVADPRYVYSQKLVLFSGIAKDTPLRMYLSDKYKIVKRFKFQDHHNYSRVDFAKINRATRDCPVAVVATTEKDSQRVLDYKRIPEDLKKKLFMVPIEVAFLSEHEQEVFQQTLLTALRNFHAEY